ncbi:hypothetical protein ECTW09195_5858, partial [Escherichia coli TW09195]
MNSPQNFLPKT